MYPMKKVVLSHSSFSILSCRLVKHFSYVPTLKEHFRTLFFFLRGQISSVSTPFKEKFPLSVFASTPFMAIQPFCFAHQTGEEILLF